MMEGFPGRINLDQQQNVLAIVSKCLTSKNQLRVIYWTIGSCRRTSVMPEGSSKLRIEQEVQVLTYFRGEEFLEIEFHVSFRDSLCTARGHTWTR